MNKNAYIIDIESFVLPYHPAPQRLTVQERKAIDQGHTVEATNKVLDFLRERNIKLTFAVVAEIYDWYPKLVERIASEGHEIGYHGHTHCMIRNVEMLEQELTMSKKFFDLFQPKCYQAPTIHFPKEGFRLLREAGFQYSNTVYQGMPYMIDGIMEIPVSTWQPASPKKREYPCHLTMPIALNCPFGSGLFTAILPRPVLHACYRKYQRLNLPTVTFIHDWQIVDMTGKNYPPLWRKLSNPLFFPYMWNIWDKCRDLFEHFSFTTMAEIYQDYKPTLIGTGV